MNSSSCGNSTTDDLISPSKRIQMTKRASVHWILVGLRFKIQSENFTFFPTILLDSFVGILIVFFSLHSMIRTWDPFSACITISSDVEWKQFRIYCPFHYLNSDGPNLIRKLLDFYQWLSVYPLSHCTFWLIMSCWHMIYSPTIFTSVWYGFSSTQKYGKMKIPLWVYAHFYS